MQNPEPGAPPTIDPLQEGTERPFWSVMIPTYNASDMLEKALCSVLDQDPGAGQMQIAVVDDCSPNGEAERIVARIAPGRVEFHRQPSNVGLSGNWNGSIARARGLWVHLLHQDDLIHDGFYDRLGLAARERPDVGAAVCRNVYVDGEGNRLAVMEGESIEAGVSADWLSRISRRQTVQCPGIVVRRSVYEHLGGFRRDLRYALDWEMWVRIASAYPVWYDPEPLASYRIHDANESARIQGGGVDIPDILKAIEIVSGHLPVELRGMAGRDILADFRDQAMRQANRLMLEGDWRAGMARIRQACDCDPSLRSSGLLRSYWRWAIKLRIRRLFHSRPASSPSRNMVSS